MKVTYRNSDTTTIEIETSKEIAVTLTESYREEDNLARKCRYHHYSYLDGCLDTVNGLGVALGDDGRNAVLGFGAIHGVRFPAVQEGEPAGDHNFLLVVKFLHFHLPP